jgi:hypothetical protein
MRFLPSLLAAALIALARSAANETHDGIRWDACMERHTGYSESQVLPVMEEMRSKLRWVGYQSQQR